MLARRSLIALGAVALTALGTSIATTSAQAVVPGQQRVFATTPPSSTSAKSITVTCPAGTRVIGGGAEVTGWPGQEIITGYTPNAALTALTATAAEDDTGLIASWTLTAQAVCAAPLPGQVLRIATTAATSVNKVAATPVCPVGTRVIGAGANTVGATGNVRLTSVQPNVILSQVTAAAAEDLSGTIANWSLTAWSICAATPVAPTLVQAFSPLNSVPKVVNVTCPAGLSPSGGGFTTGSAGRINLDAISLAPTGARVNVTEDETGLAAAWLASAQAICV
jgi:hypothetical protein